MCEEKLARALRELGAEPTLHDVVITVKGSLGDTATVKAHRAVLYCMCKPLYEVLARGLDPSAPSWDCELLVSEPATAFSIFVKTLYWPGAAPVLSSSTRPRAAAKHALSLQSLQSQFAPTKEPSLLPVLNCALHSDVQFSFTAEGGQVVFAHKAILGARSPYFKALFGIGHDGGGMAEAHSATVDVNYSSREAFLQTLEFIYTAQAKLTAEYVVEVYTLAQRFLLVDLTPKCRTVIRACTAVDNACDVLALSRLFNDDELGVHAFTVIKQNIEQIMHQVESRAYLSSLPRDVLTALADAHIDTLASAHAADLPHRSEALLQVIAGAVHASIKGAHPLWAELVMSALFHRMRRYFDDEVMMTILRLDKRLLQRLPKEAGFLVELKDYVPGPVRTATHPEVHKARSGTFVETFSQATKLPTARVVKVLVFWYRNPLGIASTRDKRHYCVTMSVGDDRLSTQLIAAELRKIQPLCFAEEPREVFHALAPSFDAHDAPDKLDLRLAHFSKIFCDLGFNVDVACVPTCLPRSVPLLVDARLPTAGSPVFYYCGGTRLVEAHPQQLLRFVQASCKNPVVVANLLA
eukprot:TRINITY_DN4531_c0_g1_i2.p1 TRINITY_DN4531_c0_g1~~TRINITY_DN4531_c0_g1_i2.p1  ORF type:complete len:580 (-),score=141.01 TRINITY_DN4531_c0_g1_i2:38-1777(-)